MKAYSKGITKEHKKAEDSVELVRKYFKELGFDVTTKSKPTSNGHDLVVLKNDKSFRVEVKTAFYSARSWKVGKTHELEHDFIAIVFNNKIHFEDWKEHKNKCSKNGQRTLTKLAGIYV